MKKLYIAKERLGIASCNVCYARNYDREQDNALGVYKENLYELHIGNQCMCLCKDCLEWISNMIVDYFNNEDKSV